MSKNLCGRAFSVGLLYPSILFVCSYLVNWFLELNVFCMVYIQSMLHLLMLSREKAVVLTDPAANQMFHTDLFALCASYRTEKLIFFDKEIRSGFHYLSNILKPCINFEVVQHYSSFRVFCLHIFFSEICLNKD